MQAVFDASAIFPGYAQSSVSLEARRCIGHYEPLVLDFTLFEAANAAATYARVNRLEPNMAQHIQSSIERAFAVAPAAGYRLQAIRWAIERNHSVYDCLYIACALDHDIPLVTADKKLASKFADVLPGKIVNLYDMPDTLP